VCQVEQCIVWLFHYWKWYRQGGVLSPYLFSRYIRGLIQSIASCHVGCSIGDMMVNILAYADDIVLLSPSWRGLQYLIDKLTLCAESINMTCNERKTVCMVFNPQSRSRTVLSSFSLLKLGTSDV